MQKLSVKEAEKILERQALLWQKMKARAKSEGSKLPMIHIEFADFSNEEFFSIYDKHVVRSADSLGMNEQELKMIIAFLKHCVPNFGACVHIVSAI